VNGRFRVPPLVSELKAAQSKAAAEPTTSSSDAPPSDTTATDTAADSESSSDSQPDDQQPSDQPGDLGSGNEGQAERVAANFTVTLLSPYVEHVQGEFWLENGVDVVKVEPPVDYQGILTSIWLVLIIVAIASMFIMYRRTRDQMMGGGGILGSITRSPARKYEESDPRVTFDDVAGLKGVKRDLKEIVDFLRDPKKFAKLGARVPKGVLLMGPPGTGKTLLAKAVAGEAGVPFFSINGSEFIQMFVGVGASRVRDMFKTAKAASPAILFIDEIDAVGRQRGAGLGGGHDEREQTLNQILSEMDGFSPSTSVIVIAATNRPDVLDPALLRPGRFDRHVTVDRPTLDGRKQLLAVHTRDIPLADDVDFDRLARATTGLTGADIRNLANEAALWATRANRDHVNMDDFEYARDKITLGDRRDDVLTDSERKLTAYHEAGHVLPGWYLPDCDRVHKVTIIPRGRALGVTHYLPDEDRHNISQSELQARLTMLLGGRTAEKLQFDEYSAGAENDLKEATKLARRMVTAWGMSERLGPIAYSHSEEHPFLGREMTHEQRQFSEHTAQVIDEEVAKILHAAADRARRVLADHHEQLTALAEALLEREELDELEIAEILGPPPHRKDWQISQPKDGAKSESPNGAVGASRE
jgi:cell division protease FtsH